MKDVLKNNLIDINKRILERPGLIHSPESFLAHISGVYDVARQTSGEITSNYRGIPLGIDEIAIAGGLHDIGRHINPLELGQLGHEIESARWIENNAFGEGFVGSLRDSYRVAQMVRSHSSVYEQVDIAKEKFPERYQLLVKEFGDIHPLLLLPRTWQEAIVTYSDLSDNNGERVYPIWKLNEAMQRYRDSPQFKDPVVVEAHRMAIGRLTQLCEKIEEAKRKKLSERDIRGFYGFM